MSTHSAGAVLYDFFQVPGGAERVTLDLARAFSADVFVGYEQPDVRAVFGYPEDSRIAALGRPQQHLRALRTYQLMRRFTRNTGFLRNYRWVVFSGNYSPLAVHNHAAGRNILYCHNLPRFIYDLRDYYRHRFSGWRRPLLEHLVRELQPKYEHAVGVMDVLVANSENVRGRIQRYLGRDAVVLHPPCGVENQHWLGQQPYYLSLSRLESYKRVDLLVRAFLRLPSKRLIIASGGSDLERLRTLAGNAPNIEFTGWLQEARLRELIGNAIATLYIPKDEDFGMSPVESMAAGKPVIGVAEGGVLETVDPEQTGILVPANPSVENIIDAVEWLNPVRALGMRHACELRAQRFSRAAFFSRMRELIDA